MFKIYHMFKLLRPETINHRNYQSLKFQTIGTTIQILQFSFLNGYKSLEPYYSGKFRTDNQEKHKTRKEKCITLNCKSKHLIVVACCAKLVFIKRLAPKSSTQMGSKYLYILQSKVLGRGRKGG